MKKIITLLVLAVSLAGCGKDEQPKPVSSALAPATPPALAPEQKPDHWKPNDGGPVNFKANEAPDPAKYKGFKF